MERPAPSRAGSEPTWVNCETRGPWVRNGLKARIEELRKSEKRVRAAYTKPFMSEPCAFIADAYAEAAAALENRLAIAASQAEPAGQAVGELTDTRLMRLASEQSVSFEVAMRPIVMNWGTELRGFMTAAIASQAERTAGDSHA